MTEATRRWSWRSWLPDISAAVSRFPLGVLLAGFLSVPSIFCGNPYILASVASVVVGGNSVAGGARGSAADLTLDLLSRRVARGGTGGPGSGGRRCCRPRR